MARRSHRTRSRQTARDYPRTARLNELFRELVAGAIDDIDEDWTDEVSVTGVAVDADIRKARVYFDCLDGPDGDEAALEHLDRVRHRLQAAVARQASTRRAPELVFLPDPAVRGGEHIDNVLREVAGAGSGNEGAGEADAAATDQDGRGATGGDGSPGR